MPKQQEYEAEVRLTVRAGSEGEARVKLGKIVSAIATLTEGTVEVAYDGEAFYPEAGA